jgi:hypothetical protein
MSAIADALLASLSDRYRIEREVGAGGTATVFLTDDLKHRRTSERHGVAAQSEIHHVSRRDRYGRTSRFP